MAVPIEHIVIAHTWDGQPIDPAAMIHLHFQAHADGLDIAVEAPFRNDPGAPEHPPGPTERLWDFEVVELFVAGPDTHYTEIELGPHGHHLVLQLSGIRTPTASGLDISFSTRREERRWHGQARIPWAYLPSGPHRVNATAIHGSGSNRTYLSWKPLTGEVPDFHQPECFASVRLPEPQEA